MCAIISVDNKRVDDRGLLRQPANGVERQRRVSQMIENSEEKRVVETTQSQTRNFINVRKHVMNLGIECAMSIVEVLLFNQVNGHHLGATALRLKRKPAVPGSDVEHTFTR